MLSRVRIQGLGVIDDAELELGPGLNVVTGETGAGKTMVVTGLGLLLGARADSGAVRDGAARAVVEGEVLVSPDHPAAQRAVAAGGDVDGGIVLVRQVGADGRSRAYVGGRAAPVGTLGELGELLVAVHGQADQWRLRHAEEHRAVLDAYGGQEVRSARDAYGAAFEEWTATRDHLARVTTTDTERTRRVELLRGGLADLDRVALSPGEEDVLAQEEERLRHADSLVQAAQEAHALLLGRDDPADLTQPATALVAAAQHALASVSGHDPHLEQLRVRLVELTVLAADLGAELASYRDGVDVDRHRLVQVQERRAEVTSVLRRYGPTSEQALAWAGGARAEVEDLDGSAQRIEELTRREAALRSTAGELARRLTGVREAAAGGLARAVASELAHLAMPSARVEVVLSSRPDPAGLPVAGALVRARSHGTDEVELRLAASSGATPRSITRAASGGELSRVMLALELVCSTGAIPTFVFDEVDAGVGGSAALDLGARLARLAQRHQVVVVTHLAQVAAFADHHLMVRRGRTARVTASDVLPVTGEQRLAELARMLGGVADSAAALRHARELVEEHAPRHLAATGRGAPGPRPGAQVPRRGTMDGT